MHIRTTRTMLIFILIGLAAAKSSANSDPAASPGYPRPGSSSSVTTSASGSASGFGRRSEWHKFYGQHYFIHDVASHRPAPRLQPSVRIPPHHRQPAALPDSKLIPQSRPYPASTVVRQPPVRPLILSDPLPRPTPAPAARHPARPFHPVHVQPTPAAAPPPVAAFTPPVVAFPPPAAPLHLVPAPEHHPLPAEGVHQRHPAPPLPPESGVGLQARFPEDPVEPHQQLPGAAGPPFNEGSDFGTATALAEAAFFDPHSDVAHGNGPPGDLAFAEFGRRSGEANLQPVFSAPSGPDLLRASAEVAPAVPDAAAHPVFGVIGLPRLVAFAAVPDLDVLHADHGDSHPHPDSEELHPHPHIEQVHPDLDVGFGDTSGFGLVDGSAAPEVPVRGHPFAAPFHVFPAIPP